MIIELVKYGVSDGATEDFMKISLLTGLNLIYKESKESRILEEPCLVHQEVDLMQRKWLKHYRKWKLTNFILLEVMELIEELWPCNKN